MKVLKLLLFPIYIVFLLYTMSSCMNEDDATANVLADLEVNADFLKLVDNGTKVAGELEIKSNSSDITLIWNTDSICNLDISQVSIPVRNGKCTLPIKWLGKLADGKLGPEGVAYKAGVKIVAGEYSKYVPLIWAERIDSAKVMEAIPMTRVAGDVMPKVAQITMVPVTVNMNKENGGSMYVGLSNASFAIFDLSEFNSDMNIDMSQIPTSITTSQILNFKWNSNGAPSYAFSANLIAYTEGITQIGVITYTPSGTGSGGTLSFKSSNLPSGNIPFAGGTYTFTFEGNYTGEVQVRCLINGTVINTGNVVVNKQPQVTVPANNTINTQNVTFQYKRADGNWLSFPASENRIQDFYNSEYVVVNGVKWARGNLLYKNNIYSFYPNQYGHSEVNGYWTLSKNPDYFAWNHLIPGIGRESNKNLGDPCTKVSGGKWRSPTYREQENLIVLQGNKVMGKYPGTNVIGLFVGRNTVPTTANEAESCLFLPAAGALVEDVDPSKDHIWDETNGYYWSNDNNSIVPKHCLYFSPSQSIVEMHYQLKFIGMAIRCVRRD